MIDVQTDTAPCGEEALPAWLAEDALTAGLFRDAIEKLIREGRNAAATALACMVRDPRIERFWREMMRLSGKSGVGSRVHRLKVLSGRIGRELPREQVFPLRRMPLAKREGTIRAIFFVGLLRMTAERACAGHDLKEVGCFAVAVLHEIFQHAHLFESVANLLTAAYGRKIKKWQVQYWACYQPKRQRRAT